MRNISDDVNGNAVHVGSSISIRSTRTIGSVFVIEIISIRTHEYSRQRGGSILISKISHT